MAINNSNKHPEHNLSCGWVDYLPSEQCDRCIQIRILWLAHSLSIFDRCFVLFLGSRYFMSPKGLESVNQIPPRRTHSIRTNRSMFPCLPQLFTLVCKLNNSGRLTSEKFGSLALDTCKLGFALFVSVLVCLFDLLMLMC